MQVKKFKELKNEKFTAVLFGVIIGIAVTFIMLFVFSAIYAMTDLEEYVNAIFATLSLIFGSFFGAMYTVGKLKQKGFINGTLVGLFIFMIIFAVSVFISDNSISLTSMFHLICCLLSGGISGIIRVNKEINKKYLK